MTPIAIIRMFRISNEKDTLNSFSETGEVTQDGISPPANNLKMFYSDNDRWIEIRLDTLRKEPRFDIIKCQSYTEKHNRIKELVCKLPRPK